MRSSGLGRNGQWLSNRTNQAAGGRHRLWARASDAARRRFQHENEDTWTRVTAISGIHADAGPDLAELLGDSRVRGAGGGFRARPYHSALQGVAGKRFVRSILGGGSECSHSQTHDESLLLLKRKLKKSASR